ncbi:MAG: TetR/AcrR family transcriptional regulator [Cyanobacteriota bacterium]|nr:TetR/AcrR family transcriptional regulator [Cyanobacteriota bacterium]
MPENHPSKTHSAASKEKPEKAKAILAGALEVFTTQGYAAASMDRIAAAAGVSKPTLYRYFEDKEGLFVALMQDLTQNSRQILFNLPTTSTQEIPPEKMLHHMATSVLAEFSGNQKLMTLMRLIIGESERFPKLARTFVREIQKPLLERLVGYLASQTQLQFSDPMVAARIFAGSLVHYLIVQNVMHGSDIVPLERDRMVDGLIQLMVAAGKSDRRSMNEE